MVNERCTRACVKDAAASAPLISRRLQMPSLDLRRSLTACGLALPPDDFITCPTNQPTSCGLAFACATLSGLAAIMSSTTFSIAPTSVTWVKLFLVTYSRGSISGLANTTSRTSLAVLPELTPAETIATIAEFAAGGTGPKTCVINPDCGLATLGSGWENG